MTIKVAINGYGRIGRRNLQVWYLACHFEQVWHATLLMA